MLSFRGSTPSIQILSRGATFKFGRAFTTTSSNWSGHNKWSKIKHNKGAQDAKKSAINGKAHRDIVVAVRGGSDTILNAVLKRVKAQGVPKQTIESALKKGSGGGSKGSQMMTFEAMVAGSIGILVDCLTDNINRTLHSVRDIVTSSGARPAPVAFMFQRRGCVRVALDKGPKFESDVEVLIDTAFSAEAEDFEQSDLEDSLDTVEMEFICPPTALAKLTAAVSEESVSKELLSSELVYRATDDSGSTADDDTLESISKLVDKLEADEDVIRVWTTLD
ncbi:hypothetical protein EIP91_009481 [Steccherinum ochraceum]|uniref:YebC-like protein n=1 Tax=Steccherinum ochraceum TaxID=92696 RepID=A0A4R0RJU8_9APHY|nr:hypothetical protein EIP91_009481 [Steccherinum ochraceum]